VRSLTFEIIASLGPASLGLVADLDAAGATSLRLNASHLHGEGLDEALDRVLAVVPASRVVVDLQGAKMRLGDMPPRSLQAGEHVVLALHPRAGAAGELELPLPHPELFEHIAVGDTLTADDGRLRFTVIDVCVSPQRLEVEALASGVLAGRKGINVSEHPVHPTGLCDSDRDAVARCTRRGVSRFALSFIADGREAAWLRSLSPHGQVIGKIERAEAITNLTGIMRRVDELWICRGDLHAQVGAAVMATFVAGLSPQRLRSLPIMMAGQVLEHLTAHSEPTRSEVCHLFDLVARDYAGIVLSDETAMGRDPVGAVTKAAGLVADFRGYTESHQARARGLRRRGA
jgi:pyruvate kinase